MENKRISEAVIEKSELERISALMEEMANAPREDFGKRQPGERCAYEISTEERRMVDNLQWAKDFMDRYERKHK